MSAEVVKAYEFGPFRLEPAERLLSRSGRPLGLTPKAFDTLQALVINEGRAISKEDLMTRVWPDAHVTEGTLAQNIFAIRKALGDADSVETVPKFGYRFRLPVRVLRGAPQKVLLLVLPFANLSGDAEQEYFSDGLTDEMITQLGRLNPERLGVVARTSAMKYKLTKKSVSEIGRELRVAYVVEGTVRRAAARVRVTAQLIQVSDETHLWSESFDRHFDDILELQSDIAQAIAKEIDVKLTPREARRLAGGRSAGVSAAAYEAYLKGRYFWNTRTEDGLKRGIAHFEEAIEREPNYAAAYDGVSDSYVMLACRGVLPARETFRRARAAALKALEIDDALGEGHATLAHVRLHDWDWVGLDDDFRRALEINPGHAVAYYWYAEYLMAMGRPDESIAMVKTAHEMDPLSSVLSASLGMILYLGRRYDEAIDYLRRSLDIDAGHFLLHFRLGLVYLQKGLQDRAIDEMTSAVALSGRSTESLTGLAQAYAAGGMRADMERAVDETREPPGRYVSPYNLARVYAAAGDTDRAFAWLDTACAERNPDLIELQAEPVFDNIRADPRFTDLRRRVGWKD